MLTPNSGPAGGPVTPIVTSARHGEEEAVRQLVKGYEANIIAERLCKPPTGKQMGEMLRVMEREEPEEHARIMALGHMDAIFDELTRRYVEAQREARGLNDENTDWVKKSEEMASEIEEYQLSREEQLRKLDEDARKAGQRVDEVPGGLGLGAPDSDPPPLPPPPTFHVERPLETVLADTESRRTSSVVVLRGCPMRSFLAKFRRKT